MKITNKLLKKHKACESQVDLFDSLFPEGTEVTEEACLKAAECGINFNWACEMLLKDINAYEAADKPFWDAYKAADKPFWDAYKAADKPLLDAYKDAEKPLLDSYNAARKPLLDSYNAARKPFLEKYKKQQALLFCKQFNEENP